MRPYVLFVVCLLSGFTSIKVAAQTKSNIDVTRPRPLEAALDELEKALGIPINYEDPRLTCRSDIEDVTDRVQTQAQRAANPKTRIYVPKSGRLVLDFTVPATPLITDAISAATLLRVQHEANDYPGRFAIKQVGSVVTIEPSSVRINDCTWKTALPAMETKISFANQARPATDTVPLILSVLSERLGIKVGLANLPLIAFVNRTVTMGATDEPANVVLVRLFEQLSGPGVIPYSYHMFYDPGLKRYMVDISAVRPVVSLPTTKPSFAPPPTGMFGAKPAKNE